MRPGDALKAYRVLAGVSIDQLLFWGGSKGTSLAKKILRDARKRLQKFDHRRRAQIDSAFNRKASQEPENQNRWRMWSFATSWFGMAHSSICPEAPRLQGPGLQPPTLDLGYAPN